MANCCCDIITNTFQLLLWLFSTAVLVLGGALLVVSLAFYYDEALNAIIQLIAQATQAYADITFENDNVDINWLFYIAYAFSGFLILTALFGCCGACCSKSAQKCYLSLFLITCGLMAAGSTTVVVLNYSQNTGINSTLYNALEEFPLDGSFSSGDYSTGFKLFEETFTCCGTILKADDNGQLNCYNWEDRKPIGCYCDATVDDNCAPMTQEETGCDIGGGTTDLYTTGCFDSIEDQAFHVVNSLGIVLICIALTTVAAALVALWICCCKSSDD